MMKLRKLNNKGFTLIELLAVVVILAVVMGIAMTSVLSSMNKARGGSLQDSAVTISQAFNQKYTESLVDGVPSNVYGDVLNNKGYNFQSTQAYYISSKLANTFNISKSAYQLDGGQVNGVQDATAATMKLSSGATNVSDSFVYFNATDAKFVVCMFANKSGSYYVDNYKKNNTAASSFKDITPSFNFTAAKDTMFACSDGTKSW